MPPRQTTDNLVVHDDQLQRCTVCQFDKFTNRKASRTAFFQLRLQQLADVITAYWNYRSAENIVLANAMLFMPTKVHTTACASYKEV